MMKNISKSNLFRWAIHNTTTVFRAAVQENNKHYPQVSLDECLYDLYVTKIFFIMIELTFLKELMLMKKSESKEWDICYTWYFLNKRFKFQPKVWNRSHDLLMMSINLGNIAIIKIKGSGCFYIISETSKKKAINLMQNIDLTKISITL